MKNIFKIKPVFYSLCWLKAMTQVMTQRAAMLWLFYFTSPSTGITTFKKEN